MYNYFLRSLSVLKVILKYITAKKTAYRFSYCRLVNRIIIIYYVHIITILVLFIVLLGRKTQALTTRVGHYPINTSKSIIPPTLATILVPWF